MARCGLPLGFLVTAGFSLTSNLVWFLLILEPFSLLLSSKQLLCPLQRSSTIHQKSALWGDGGGCQEKNKRPPVWLSDMEGVIFPACCQSTLVCLLWTIVSFPAPGGHSSPSCWLREFSDFTMWYCFFLFLSFFFVYRLLSPGEMAIISYNPYECEEKQYVGCFCWCFFLYRHIVQNKNSKRKKGCSLCCWIGMGGIHLCVWCWGISPRPYICKDISSPLSYTPASRKNSFHGDPVYLLCFICKWTENVGTHSQASNLNDRRYCSFPILSLSSLARVLWHGHPFGQECSLWHGGLSCQPVEQVNSVRWSWKLLKAMFFSKCKSRASS